MLNVIRNLMKKRKKSKSIIKCYKNKSVCSLLDENNLFYSNKFNNSGTLDNNLLIFIKFLICTIKLC